MLKRQVQTALRTLFPPSCSACDGLVDSDFALCGLCWRELPFISGPVCTKCGIGILGESADEHACCDDCIKQERPWNSGRAAMMYTGLARSLVLRLKHGDRPDIAKTAAVWLESAARPMLTNETVIVPVPLHWSRLVKQKFNQSALLSQNLALKSHLLTIPDALVRVRKTAPLDGAVVDERFRRLSGAIEASPKRAHKLQGKPVLIVDDVMTSGATLAAATEACHQAGASKVNVLVLARVGKDDYMNTG